jgi:DNA polymerase II small subunit
VDEIVRPGVMGNRNRKIKEDISVAIISDVHVGSKTFIRERWEKFLEWLKRGEGEAGKIKYLLIAGDVVDGIGVYPHQEEELDILDIFDQYEALARYLDEVPDYIKTVIIPGNHDIVRNAEPQPALPDEIAKMFSGDVELLSNPSMFSIHGYNFIMYHGASLNNLVELIPGMDYQKTSDIMQYMLEMRHLSPVYGEKVPIVPTPRDYLVIDRVPDVLITGHVHIFSYKMYRGVHMVNASAWQEQTKYQKMMNFNPDPGKVAILNLKEDRMSVKAF